MKSKQVKKAPKRTNGVGKKRQYGAQKLSSSTTSGKANSSSGNNLHEITNDQTTAELAKRTMLLIKQGEQNVDSDVDSSNDDSTHFCSKDDDDDDDSDCCDDDDDDDSDCCDDDDHSHATDDSSNSCTNDSDDSELSCEGSSGSQSQSESQSQFSEEYTLSSSGDSTPAATAPAARGTAPKRLASNNMAPALKLPKLTQQVMKQQQQQNAQLGVATIAKSCPLPSKVAVKTGPKSCPLPPKVGNKMAAKSCPLPKKNEKQQQQDRRSLPVETKRNVETATTSRKSENGAAEKKEKVKEKDIEKEPRKPVHQQNSIEEGKRVLFWLLNPVKPEVFFNQYWEKNACQVQRKRPQYFSELISFKMIDEMLIRNHLEFTTNIDVTSYIDGVRETHNPDGRAMPPAVWGYYGDGCSIRILNPSTYLSGLRQVCTAMQEYFHCLVGANVYLTPPNSQGFAPHYDDIEAFVLQVEGRKRWRLYVPPLPSDVLGRVSSGNYKQEQLGEPIFDAVLHPGDILYFPRGTVHQAVTEKNHHSLHITLSVYQQQSYANLLEQLMPAVLQRAIKHNLSLRRGLPLHTWHHLGLAHGAQQSEQRTQMLKDVNRLVQQYLMPSELQIDAAVDQLAKRFQHEALPPVVLPEEHVRTVFGSRSTPDANGQCLCDYELTEQTSVRLLRANIVRLVGEGTSLRLYYYVDNALEYCKYEANFMEIQATEAAAVETLITAYPNYCKISTLPLRSADRRIEVATALWERGLLMTEKPFKK